MDAQRRLFTSRLPKVKAETDAYQAQQKRSQLTVASAGSAGEDVAAVIVAAATQQHQMQAPVVRAKNTPASVPMGGHREERNEARGDKGQEDRQPSSFDHLPMKFLDENLDPEEGVNIYDVQGNISKARAAAAFTVSTATAAVPRDSSLTETPAGDSAFSQPCGGPEGLTISSGGGVMSAGEGDDHAVIPLADATVVAAPATSRSAVPLQPQVQQQQQRPEAASSKLSQGSAVEPLPLATAVSGAAVAISPVVVTGQTPRAPPRQAKLGFTPPRVLPAAIATDGWSIGETESIRSAWTGDGDAGSSGASAMRGGVGEVVKERGVESDAAVRALREAEEQAEMLEEDDLLVNFGGGSGGGWWSEPPGD